MTRVWMPSPTQELLLRAALASDEEATRAYYAWRDVIGDAAPMTLDVGSQRLLPLVYRRHRAPDLKALYLKSWTTNVRLLRVLAATLADLRAHGIEALVLKGAALATPYYGDLGARPMSDIDILLRPADVPRALAWLRADGWQLERPMPAWVGNPADEPIGHGWSLLRDDIAIDVHWYAIPQSCQRDADRELWSHSETLTMNGFGAQTPSATEHLLHTLAHGVMFNPIPPIRWIADALMILKRPIDWGRLLRETERRGLTLAVRETLRWLVEHFAIEAPILRALENRQPRLWDRWRYEHALHPWNDRETIGHAWMDWWRYAEGRPLGAAPRICARYCAHRWGFRPPA